jgi:RNA polymerase sigma-70 factor (sigma-E family)
MGWQDDVTTLARDRGPALVGYAYLLVGDLAAAQDLVQDAFVKTFVRLRAGHDLDHLEAYVRRAILNGLRDGLRRRASFTAAAPRLVDHPPGDEVQGVAERVDLERALAGLAPRVRACLVLRHYEGMTVAEVAQALGLSDGAVKRYLSDGRACLGALLADVQEDADETERVRLAPDGARRTGRSR